MDKGKGRVDKDGPLGNIARETRLKPSPGDCETLICGHKMGGRNLIVNMDGTGNQFGYQNSNVVEMYRMIEKTTSDNQHTWYSSGIGTYARPHWKSLAYYKQVLSHWMDMAIAWNFEKTVQDAYRWLANKYQDGDSIFLFGFSRGAFQARVLAAMIEKVGLIHEGNEAQIPFAYELYADPRTGDGDPGPLSAAGSTTVGPNAISCQAARFKAAFSREVKVHFVGAWDTVSSIGLARGTKLLPGTTDGMKQVCYFRQALALDERRVKFQPEYAYGGSATARPDSKAHGDTAAEPRTTNIPSTLTDQKPQTLEVWFAGTHSDIGGGNTYNAEMNRSRPPLRWMAHEAESLGLRIKKFERDLRVDEQINFVESLTWFWWIFEIIPFLRLAFSRRPEAWGETTYWPHLGASRKVHEGQKIHSSILFGKTYTPKALLPTGSGLYSFDPWRKLREDGVAQRHGLLEIDMIDYARATLKTYLAKPSDGTYDYLQRIADYGTGPQLLYDEIIKDIQGWLAEQIPNLDGRCRLLDTGVKLLCPKASSLTLRSKADLRPLILAGNYSQDERMVASATAFFRHLTNLCILKLDGHTNWVRSVAFSFDGTRIVSGSDDRSVRVWDAHMGDLLKTLEGHTRGVLGVAFSSDGTRIVSGSYNESVRVWEAQTGELLKKLEGHSSWLRSVAFSSDGTRIVSSSDDESVRVWDAQTEDLLKTLEGHTDWVRSVAFSSDGTRIVSGSNDESVRVWDAHTGDLLKKLEGHSSWVNSVAFSSDGTRIVSGSSDHSVRVWDAQTGDLLKKLEGHSSWLQSVAFSSDGTRIVSGSDDKSVRVWDVADI